MANAKIALGVFASFISFSIPLDLQSDMFYWQQIITVSVFGMSDIFFSSVAVQGLL